MNDEPFSGLIWVVKEIARYFNTATKALLGSDTLPASRSPDQDFELENKHVGFVVTLNPKPQTLYTLNPKPKRQTRNVSVLLA